MSGGPLARGSRVIPFGLGAGLTGMICLAMACTPLDAPQVVVASPTPRTTSIPTAASTMRATSPPPTAAPITPTPTFEPAKNPKLLVIDGWGIRLRRSATAPWHAVEVGFDGNRIGIDAVADQTRYVLVGARDQTARDIYFGACDAAGCAGPLVTISIARAGAGLLVGTRSCEEAPPNFYFDCLASNDLWPRTITGSTLATLKQAWLSEFGPAAVTRTSLGGAPAVRLEWTGGGPALLSVHGELLVAVLVPPGWGGTDDEAVAAFEAVIGNFRFDDLPAS